MLCYYFSKRSDLQHTSGVVTVWAFVWALKVYLTVWCWCVCLYALVAVFADRVECALICQITHSSTHPTGNISRVGFPGNNTTTCLSDLRYRKAVQKHKYTQDERTWETEAARGGGTPLNPTEHLGSQPKSQHRRAKAQLKFLISIYELLFRSYIQQYLTHQRGAFSKHWNKCERVFVLYYLVKINVTILLWYVLFILKLNNFKYKHMR